MVGTFDGSFARRQIWHALRVAEHTKPGGKE